MTFYLFPDDDSYQYRYLPLLVFLLGFAIRRSDIDPETGEQKPIPYGYGFIQLDGSDTLFQHYISIDDESKVKIGARVEPVFSEERKGTIRDIQFFRIVD